MRVGPPLLQPFYDIAKLMIKETCVPAGGAGLALPRRPAARAWPASPLASTILWRALLDPAAAFVGDLIVLLYLLTMPALAVILGAFASRNPLASLGGSREMKLILAYELPFVLAVLRARHPGATASAWARSSRAGPPCTQLSGVLALAGGDPLHAGQADPGAVRRAGGGDGTHAAGPTSSIPGRPWPCSS